MDAITLKKHDEAQRTRQHFAGLPRPQLLDLARSYQWVHTINLGDFTTPGLWGAGNPEIWRAFDQIDFRGKRVLDIGCWDGNWTFEAESRGAAEVIATDLISQRDFNDQRAFEVAAALLGSRARYIPDLSVYDVERLGEKFDVILFMGIYYHLKDPLRSLTVLRNVMNPSAQIIIEGAILTDPGCYAKFFYQDIFCGESSNWWVPTVECLRQWTRCSFMDVEWEGRQWGHMENQRHCLIARARHGHDPLYSRAPEELEHFNV